MLKYLWFLFTFSIVPVTPMTYYFMPLILLHFPWMAKELVFFPIAMWVAMLSACIFWGTIVYIVNGNYKFITIKRRET